MRVNNIEIEKVSKSIEEFRAEPDKAVKTISVEGDWQLDTHLSNLSQQLRPKMTPPSLRSTNPAFSAVAEAVQAPCTTA